MEQKLEGSKIPSLCSKDVGKVVTVVKEAITEAAVSRGVGWDPLASQIPFVIYQRKKKSED